DRLCSIQEDGNFITEVVEAFPNLAVVANQRCGNWYVDPKVRNDRVNEAYFKSTDGHTGQWSFNLRRLNLPFARLALAHGGCILVDSTRRGKRLPDALSKTVPIWCAVLNGAIKRQRDALSSGKDTVHRVIDWNTAFYAPPSTVSDSERAQIAEKISGWVDALLSSPADLNDLVDPVNGLRKPFRPIWVHPGSRILENPSNYLSPEFSFTPILCVCASTSGPGTMKRRPGYYYVQGAADDEEEWNRGLTASIYWNNRESLCTQPSAQASISLIQKLVHNPKEQPVSRKKGSMVQTMPLATPIGSTGVFIGRRRSGRPPECWEAYDAIINCSHLEYLGMAEPAHQGKYLFLNIPEGKRGERQLGQAIPTALAFALPHVLARHRILIHCSQGKDRSVGIALSVLLAFFSEQGNDNASLVLSKSTSMLLLTKQDIQARLLAVQQAHPYSMPTRETLKQVHRYFL
ncbi:tRNA A64-2'-O-ribosylphosphate transferase, partial [Piptocephalis cylindrospora]